MQLIVPAHSVTTYVRGQPPAILAGDLLLVRHHSVSASGIRAAERMRRPRSVARKEWLAYCTVNHAAVAIGDDMVVQATGRGIVQTPVDTLNFWGLGVVGMFPAPAQLAATKAFAQATVGCGYGFAQIPADLFNAISGLELTLGWGDRMTCSTATCRTAEREGLVPDRAPGCVTPAHLAWYFGVKVPAI